MTSDLDHYLQIWNLADPQLLAETNSSRVYSVITGGEKVVLKLLTPAGISDEQDGAVVLRYWSGQGAIHLLRADDGAHLLEYVEGKNLTEMVERGHDERATIIIAGVLNQLHGVNTQPHPTGLRTLRQRFESLFTKAADDKQNGIASIFVRAARVAEELLAHPRDIRVLHGDIHHYNIRLSAQRGWLAFDPKGLVGERTYDAANTLCNPDLPELVETEARLLKNASILAEHMGIEVSRILAFVYVYACLNASWYRPHPAHDLKMAQLAEPHVQH